VHTLPTTMIRTLAAVAGAERFLAQAVGLLAKRLSSPPQQPADYPHPAESRRLSVGWWTLVSTTVESTRSLRPRVTFTERASSTARSLSDATVP
jgi:hypothetical protein